MSVQNESPEEGKLLWYKEGDHARLGFLQGVSQDGGKEIFVVADVQGKKNVIVNPEDCWPTKPDEVRSGLLGICCTHPSCGLGTIIDEYFDKELSITVVCRDGQVQGFTLKEVFLCCFYI